ncbi:MAG: PEP-CTERM sorting domain-containing protein [Planctomycetota bacterium]
MSAPLPQLESPPPRRTRPAQLVAAALLAVAALAPAGMAHAQFEGFPPVLFFMKYPEDTPQVVLDAGDQAIAFWEQHITGYNGYETGDAPILFNVSINFEAGDPLGVVAFAAGGGPLTLDTGQRIPTNGFMTIDSTDIDFLVDRDWLEPVIRHELGHILGFDPQWWGLNGYYTRGSGRYLGPQGIATFQDEYDPTATFVPVGLGDNGGDAHWPEDSLLTDAQGRLFGEELMSPIINGSLHVSDTTLATLRDIGWQTLPTAVPEPASAVALGFLGVCVGRRRR